MTMMRSLENMTKWAALHRGTDIPFRHPIGGGCGGGANSSASEHVDPNLFDGFPAEIQRSLLLLLLTPLPNLYRI